MWYVCVVICASCERSVLYMSKFVLQHASNDVEKIIVGNKCDMTDIRMVSTKHAEDVRLRLLNPIQCFLHDRMLRLAYICMHVFWDVYIYVCVFLHLCISFSKN